MSNQLIVRFRFVAALSFVFILPGVAIASAMPLTAEQITERKNREATEAAAEEKAENEAVHHRARLVAIVDRYKVWSIWDAYHGQHIYVTTPCGNTQWFEHRQVGVVGKGGHIVVDRKEMPSVECKP